MAEREAARPDGIEVVTIATPNHMHFAPARAFLARGIHVICDKPVTHRLEDALTLASAVAHSGLVFALMHNYTGYPLVRQAREMVARGALGTIRVVQAEIDHGVRLSRPPGTAVARLPPSAELASDVNTDFPANIITPFNHAQSAVP
jgi:predicted dehydrogenase